jgi:hypothetical protein
MILHDKNKRAKMHNNGSNCNQNYKWSERHVLLNKTIDGIIARAKVEKDNDSNNTIDNMIEKQEKQNYA